MKAYLLIFTKNVWSFLFFCALVMIILGLGAYFIKIGTPSMFTEIIKPSWSPPGYVFAPVWTFLYATIAVSGWIIWLTKKNVLASDLSANSIPLSSSVWFSSKIEPSLDLYKKFIIWGFFFYFLQLILNITWTYLYFVLGNIGLALSEIILLLFAVTMTIYYFWQIFKVAAILLFPYWFWLVFAVILNYTIWRLN